MQRRTPRRNCQLRARRNAVLNLNIQCGVFIMTQITPLGEFFNDEDCKLYRTSNGVFVGKHNVMLSIDSKCSKTNIDFNTTLSRDEIKALKYGLMPRVRVHHIYIGEFHNNQRHGYGIIIYPYTSAYYRGEWRDDIPYGKGTFCDECARKWSGTWDGFTLISGVYSVQSHVDHRVIEMNVKENERETNAGKITYQCGSYYYGSIEKDYRAGYGTYYDALCKRKYVGYHVDDVKHGSGKLYDQENKLIRSGEWENDTMVSGINYIYCENGTVIQQDMRGAIIYNMADIARLNDQVQVLAERIDARNPTSTPGQIDEPTDKHDEPTDDLAARCPHSSCQRTVTSVFHQMYRPRQNKQCHLQKR